MRSARRILLGAVASAVCGVAFAACGSRRADSRRPVLISVDPPPFAMGVDPGATITLTFSEPMAPTSMDGAVYIAAGPVRIDGATTTNGATVRFTPDRLLPLGVPVFAVISTAAESVAGVRLAGAISPFAIRDGSLEKPRKLAVWPPDVAALYDGGAVAVAAGRVQVRSHSGGWSAPTLEHGGFSGGVTAVAANGMGAYIETADIIQSTCVEYVSSSGAFAPAVCFPFAGGAGCGAWFVSVELTSAPSGALSADQINSCVEGPNGTGEPHSNTYLFRETGYATTSLGIFYGSVSATEIGHSGVVLAVVGGAQVDIVTPDGTTPEVAPYIFAAVASAAGSWDGARLVWINTTGGVLSQTATACLPSVCWSDAEEIDGGAPAAPTFAEVRATEAGNAVAAWLDPGGNVVATVFDPSTGWSTPETLGTPEDRHHLDLAITPSGTAWVVWMDTGAHAVVASTRSGEGWTPPMPISAPVDGLAWGYPMIRQAPAGNFVVAWATTAGESFASVFD